MTLTHMHHTRRGSGPPLLLVHGLGASGGSWSPIADGLAAQREVIAVDLPGHGDSPRLAGEETIEAMVDALEAWMGEQDLREVDVVGSSMGARMVLELARRGVGGAVVALDPGGFWTPTQAKVFHASLKASVGLVKRIRPALPALLGNPVSRTALLAQFSAAPWRLDGSYALAEMQRIAATEAFMPLLDALAQGPTQAGMPAGSSRRPLTIVWGLQDWVTPASQAKTAAERFPDAAMVRINRCGHFPFWDQPAEVLQITLDRTG